MRETGRDIGRGRSRLHSMQGARCGTGPRVSRTTPGTESGAKPLSHPGCPPRAFQNYCFYAVSLWAVFCTVSLRARTQFPLTLLALPDISLMIF